MSKDPGAHVMVSRNKKVSVAELNRARKSGGQGMRGSSGGPDPSRPWATLEAEPMGGARARAVGCGPTMPVPVAPIRWNSVISTGELPNLLRGSWPGEVVSLTPLIFTEVFRKGKPLSSLSLSQSHTSGPDSGPEFAISGSILALRT